MKVTPEEHARQMELLAEALPWLGVELQVEQAAEAVDKGAEVSPELSGRLKASWDPAINRTRSFTGNPGSLPTGEQARSTYRRLRPGDRALVTNAAREPGDDGAYAELVLERGLSDQLQGQWTEVLGEHLKAEIQPIARRAERRFVRTHLQEAGEE